jgi:tRNA uridine 5-carbamoylmethylation protein Kti12
MMDTLETLDINTINPNSIILVLGKKSTGKTVLVKNILKTVAKDSIPTIVCSNEYEIGSYNDIKPDITIHKEYDEKIVDDLHFKVRKAFANNKIANNILVLDDVLYDNKWMKSINIRSIFMNNRGYKMGMIITMQYPLTLLPMLRTNIDYVFLYKNCNNSTKRIYDEYFSEVLPENEFLELYDKLDMWDHKCIFYDIFKNKLYSFKADV